MAEKQQNVDRDRFILTKSLRNPSSGYGEEVENVTSLPRRSERKGDVVGRTDDAIRQNRYPAVVLICYSSYYTHSYP